MGSEDLFHKRKARKAEESLRKKSKRMPYEKVLIVTEGEKTEPLYFEEMKIILELDSANIEIDGDCGSSPISVVNHAYDLYLKEASSGDSYNKIFCVFDRDSHTTFNEALLRIVKINEYLDELGLSQQVEFREIISIPSFEYWLLLHYNPTTKPYVASQTKSPGDNVISDLRMYIPDYKKTQKGFYTRSVEDGTLNGAIANSKRIFDLASQTGDNNPCTNVHELVDFLQKLKNN